MNMYENISMISLDQINAIQRLQADVVRLTIENEKLLNKIAKNQFELDGVVSKWISVKDRLPEPLEDVLTIDSNGNIFISWLKEFGDGRFAYDTRGNHGNITHWMPLPDPPKE